MIKINGKYCLSRLAICVILSNFVIAHVSTVSTKDIQFDTADLTIDISTDNGIDHLEAFRSAKNQQIIDGKDKSKYSQLAWLSIGVPKLVQSITSRGINLFDFNDEGFNFKIEMLTKNNKHKLVEVIKRKYDIEVVDEQIITLIPSVFKCDVRFYVNNTSNYIRGAAKNLMSFPIRVDFDAPEGSKERVLFEQKIKSTALDLAFDCTFFLNGKTSKSNVLQISGQQFNDYNLTDAIFGPASVVYVTREQMSNLVTELYMKLNIIEDYQISESEFSQGFVQDFIKQVADAVETNISFDDALNAMSSYNFHNDLKADVIKKDLGSIFAIKKSGSKSNIILNEDNYLLKTASASGATYSSSSSVIIGLLGKGCMSRSLNYYKNEASDATRHDKSLNDQLNELNKFTEDSVTWQIEGDKVMPKSIKVTRLVKSHFSKKLVFHRIRRLYYDVLYEKSFTLYTKKAHTNDREDHLETTKVEINTLKAMYTELFNQSKSNSHNIMKLFGPMDEMKADIKALKEIFRYHQTSTKTLTGHTDIVGSLVILPNGDLASGSADNTIKIWNINDGSVKRTLKGHTSYVRSLVILPNGDLASGSDDETIKIWNINDGSVKRTLTGHTSYVGSLVILPNGDLASGSDDKIIKIWNINDGSVKRTLTGHTNTVRSLVILPNGDLASGSDDETIKIWNINDGSVKRTLTGHTWYVWSLVILPNGDLASGSADNTIKIWNINDGSVKRTLTGHTSYVRSLVILPNGDLASGSDDKIIKIWNINDGSFKRTLTGHTKTVTSLVILPNGDLASGSYDRTIKIWN